MANRGRGNGRGHHHTSVAAHGDASSPRVGPSSSSSSPAKQHNGDKKTNNGSNGMSRVGSDGDLLAMDGFDSPSLPARRLSSSGDSPVGSPSTNFSLDATHHTTTNGSLLIDGNDDNDDRSSPITIITSGHRAIPSRAGTAAAANDDEKKRHIKRTIRQQDEHDRVSESVELDREIRAGSVREVRISMAETIGAIPTMSPTSDGIPLDIKLARQPPTAAKLSVGDFELLSVIGRGGFAKVFQVRKRDTGKVYAMKVLKKKDVIEKNVVDNTRSERQVLEVVDHPFIVRLRFAFQTESKLYLILDYVGGGEFFTRLNEENELAEEHCQFYAAEVLLALEHLHSRDILYRDLKPENILLHPDGHLCLTDFGFAKKTDSSDESTRTMCGTLQYMAPEVIQRTGHSKPADWWAYGCLIYEMMTGRTPFHGPNRKAIQSNIISGKFKMKPMSYHLQQLIQSLLRKAIPKRLGTKGADEIKKHAFFKGVDWKLLGERKIAPPFIPGSSVHDLSRFATKFTSEIPVDSPSTPHLVGMAGAPHDPSRSPSPFHGFSFTSEPLYLGAAAIAGIPPVAMPSPLLGAVPHGSNISGHHHLSVVPLRLTQSSPASSPSMRPLHHHHHITTNTAGVAGLPPLHLGHSTSSSIATTTTFAMLPPAARSLSRSNSLSNTAANIATANAATIITAAAAGATTVVASITLTPVVSSSSSSSSSTMSISSTIMPAVSSTSFESGSLLALRTITSTSTAAIHGFAVASPITASRRLHASSNGHDSPDRTPTDVVGVGHWPAPHSGMTSAVMSSSSSVSPSSSSSVFAPIIASSSNVTTSVITAPTPVRTSPILPSSSSSSSPSLLSSTSAPISTSGVVSVLARHASPPALGTIREKADRERHAREQEELEAAKKSSSNASSNATATNNTTSSVSASVEVKKPAVKSLLAHALSNRGKTGTPATTPAAAPAVVTVAATSTSNKSAMVAAPAAASAASSVSSSSSVWSRGVPSSSSSSSLVATNVPVTSAWAVPGRSTTIVSSLASATSSSSSSSSSIWSSNGRSSTTIPAATLVAVTAADEWQVQQKKGGKRKPHNSKV